MSGTFRPTLRIGPNCDHKNPIIPLGSLWHRPYQFNSICQGQPAWSSSLLPAAHFLPHLAYFTALIILLKYPVIAGQYRVSLSQFSDLNTTEWAIPLYLPCHSLSGDKRVHNPPTCFVSLYWSYSYYSIRPFDM